MVIFRQWYVHYSKHIFVIVLQLDYTTCSDYWKHKIFIQQFDFALNMASVWLYSFTLSQLLINFDVKCDIIRNNGTFYHEYISTYPSKYATVEYSVQYMSELAQNGTLILDIYTDDDWSPEHECSNRTYGQLRNSNLHLLLVSPFSTCEQTGSRETFCTGKTTIQDYIPRQYSFSIGFDCKSLRKASLNGVYFNISISQQANHTKCSKIPHAQSQAMSLNCLKLYSTTSFPNPVGSQTLAEGMASMNQFYVRYLEALTLNRTSSCYKMVSELICHIFIPKCGERELPTISPCREMCEDFFEACEGFLSSHVFKMNCQYLPSQNGNIPCLYKPVTCGRPSALNNGLEIAFTEQEYMVNTEIEYSCKDKGYIMNGEGTRRCLYSGRWSTEPKCVSEGSDRLLKVFLPVTILVVLIIFSGGLYFRFKWKASSGKTLSRNREYDAALFYNFDCDDEFAMDTILPALEETHDPPFKLCVHSRDFTPGMHIKDNIEDSISRSNSAIIIMSQAFLDSRWCMEEFKQVYFEHLLDPTFKLFAIIMQPEHTLTNKPSYMNGNFDFYRFHKNDPRLLQKISKNLTVLKEPVIKSRTRLIMESIRNVSICGQTHSGSSLAIFEETSFSEQPNNNEEEQENAEPLLPDETVVDTVIDVHTEKRHDFELVDTVVDIHTDSRHDYELLEEECDALDRYNEKILNDTSENESKEGLIERNISDQASIAEVERDFEFEKEGGELNKVKLYSLSYTTVDRGNKEDNEGTKQRNSTDLERSLTSHEESHTTNMDGTTTEMGLHTADRKSLDPECNQTEVTERQGKSPEDVKNSTHLANFVEEIPLTEKTHVTTGRNPSREKNDKEEKEHNQYTYIKIEPDMEQKKYDSESFMIREDRALAKMRSKLSRSRRFDAFVSFHHSGPHRDFVFNQILARSQIPCSCRLHTHRCRAPRTYPRCAANSCSCQV